MSIERAIDGHMMAKVSRLREMGFEDELLSKAALEQVGGNVNLAIEKIISGGVSAPTSSKDEPRGGSAAGIWASAQKGGAIASIFNLSQRSVSSVQSSTGGSVAAVFGGIGCAQKPRSRPTASTSKPARQLSRSATGSSAAVGGIGQGLMGMMLPLKRDRDAKACTAGAGAAPGEVGAPSRERLCGVVEDDDVCTVPSDDDVPGCGSSSTGEAAGVGSASWGADSGAAAGVASFLKRQRVGEDGGGINHFLTRGDASTHRPGARGAGSTVPLAERMRPCSLDGFVGQESVRKVVDGLLAHTLPSMILWGPPGCGKTSLAKLLLKMGEGKGGKGPKEGGAFRAVSLSAVSVGMAEVRQVVKTATTNRNLLAVKTVLFLDEIHRFNKVQQDALLPHVESGLLTLIGATTENPSFCINKALLSRCQVVVLDKLAPHDIRSLLLRAVDGIRACMHGGSCPPASADAALEEDSLRRGSGSVSRPASSSQDATEKTTVKTVRIDDKALHVLTRLADGDARAALNTLEQALHHATQRCRRAAHASSCRHASSHPSSRRPDCEGERGDGRDSVGGGGGGGGRGGGGERGSAGTLGDSSSHGSSDDSSSLAAAAAGKAPSCRSSAKFQTPARNRGRDSEASPVEESAEDKELEDIETPPAAVDPGVGDSGKGGGEEKGKGFVEEEEAGVVSAASEDDEGGLCVEIEADDVRLALQQRTVPHDAGGDAHYTLISALHKSIRGSDVQASIYWLARLLEGGESPEFVARRLLRVASEDVGLADPSALPQAVAAMQTVKAIGMPECNLALMQCTVYLAMAPKCNGLYTAYSKARAVVLNQPLYPVPLHLRNAPTQLLTSLGWGDGYKYNHDFPDGAPDQIYLPQELEGTAFLAPRSLATPLSPAY